MADSLSMNYTRVRQVLECGGKAKRRHRFQDVRPGRQSGVALRFPPHSKTLTRTCPHLAGSWSQCAICESKLPMNRSHCRQVLDCGDGVREVTALIAPESPRTQTCATTPRRPKAATPKTPSPHSKTLARGPKLRAPMRIQSWTWRLPMNPPVLRATTSHETNGCWYTTTCSYFRGNRERGRPASEFAQRLAGVDLAARRRRTRSRDDCATPRSGSRMVLLLRHPVPHDGGNHMNDKPSAALLLTSMKTSSAFKPKHVYLVANGDLRLSANQKCWPAQAKWKPPRSGLCRPKAGKSSALTPGTNQEARVHDSQKMGMEVSGRSTQTPLSSSPNPSGSTASICCPDSSPIAAPSSPSPIGAAPGPGWWAC